MKPFHYPPSYSFFQGLLKSVQFLNDPIGVITTTIKKFKGSYAVNLPNKQKLIMTQNPDFIAHILQKNHKNYYKSPFVSEKLGRFIGNGLLTANGPYWLRQRRLIQPGFHIKTITTLFENIAGTVDKSLKTFPRGKNIDIYSEMNAISLEIILNSLFNIKIKPEKRRILAKNIYELQSYIVKEIRRPYFKWWYLLSGQDNRALKLSDETRNIIKSIIVERKQQSTKYNDLLDMLLDTRYEDTGEGMTEQQLIDEIMILIVAGHETTANTLSWTLHFLAKNPKIYKRIKLETANLSTIETTKNQSLNNVLNESMRLYPPAWVTDRVCLENDTFENYHYEKGTIVIAFLYGLHRDPQLWDQPETYNPDRFNGKQNKYSKQFFPFGAGPRMCIGNNFAMAEMQIFLQKFIKNFELNNPKQTPKAKALITLKPENLRLVVT